MTDEPTNHEPVHEPVIEIPTVEYVQGPLPGMDDGWLIEQQRAELSRIREVNAALFGEASRLGASPPGAPILNARLDAVIAVLAPTESERLAIEIAFEQNMTPLLRHAVQTGSQAQLLTAPDQPPPGSGLLIPRH